MRPKDRPTPAPRAAAAVPAAVPARRIAPSPAPAAAFPHGSRGRRRLQQAARCDPVRPLQAGRGKNI
jgi:hypothetical protein